MGESINEITKLTDEWYRLVAKDHHKDRDCHWFIETAWSYGQPPKYFIRHNGYILDKIEILCDNYDEALIKLKNFLEISVKEERTHQENEDFGW